MTALLSTRHVKKLLQVSSMEVPCFINTFPEKNLPKNLTLIKSTRRPMSASVLILLYYVCIMYDWPMFTTQCLQSVFPWALYIQKLVTAEGTLVAILTITSRPRGVINEGSTRNSKALKIEDKKIYIYFYKYF